ncbi:C4-dicarboxylate ABC transporter [Photobacterium sanctipauli]|uniref:C4-dicarboxylate ABC transporter n=1 Tax=Photobacterium sanctipauli TaxID=1342794 RepID=A0A2T3P1B8_9GAMM|nr:C4-dicarboxylate transporter DcuC [Photobacterium sanctipauli]PSW22315.1 C4-dicarboxylate ABC transporter [Photobacterium sanctipauli]
MVPLLSLPIIFGAGYLIVKKYNTQAALFGAGLLMILIGVISGNTEFLPSGTSSSGAIVFDFFLVIKAISSSTVANLGLIIMSVAGFSSYMNHIGAANAMVQVSTKPLSLFKSPYVVLALTYILGQVLNIFIPSAVGLAMLLLVAMYPVLVRIGCTPASTAAVLATTACLDLGPASGNSLKAAEVIGIDAAAYFVSHQMIVAPVVMGTIAVLHYFCQRWFDKKDAEKGITHELKVEDKEEAQAPKWFAILPVLPLFMLLTFSSFAIDTIKVDVVTAMFTSLFIAMVCDFIVNRNGKKVAASLKVFLDGMGKAFASVVSLIIAAQTFVVGLSTIGFISMLLGATSTAGLGYLPMVIVMVSIIGATALLSGSGNAPFFSFSNLAPEVAATLGVSTAAFALPMQLSAGIFRSFSPVAGVVIACAGAAGVSPIELVKRTAIPMMGGLVALVAMSAFLG